MDFVRAQFTKIPTITPVNLSLRTVLITGVTSGLGLEAAREILKSKPKRLILGVRDLERGKAVVSQLQNNITTSTQFDLRHLDQASFASIKSFADGLAGETVDIAILNAGVWNFKFNATSDGYESDLQVNVLSPALLSLLLLPNLREAATAAQSSSPSFKPRLSFVSSGLHGMAKFPERKLPAGEILATLNDPKKYDGSDRYPTTKLLGLLWTKELAKREEAQGKQIIINAPNPGFCNTGLLKGASGIMKVIIKLVGMLMGRKPEDGARCIIDAVLVKGEESHGKYLSEATFVQEADIARGSEGEELQEKIWGEIVEVFSREGVLPEGFAE